MGKRAGAHAQPRRFGDAHRLVRCFSGLQRLRRIRLEFWLGCLGWIAVNIIAVTVVARFDEGGLVTSVIQGLSTLGLTFLLGRAAYAKCPSCGETVAAREYGATSSREDACIADRTSTERSGRDHRLAQSDRKRSLSFDSE